MSFPSDPRRMRPDPRQSSSSKSSEPPGDTAAVPVQQPRQPGDTAGSPIEQPGDTAPDSITDLSSSLDVPLLHSSPHCPPQSLQPTSVPSWPSEGTLCGIDFGTVRIGLALCDRSQTWASPAETYQRQNPRRDAEFFLALVNRERVVGFVVGSPVHCDGRESQKSQQVREFCDWLGELTQLPIRLFDERFSTAQARMLLQESGLSPQKRKQRLDRIAAQVILANFLESGSPESQTGEPLDDRI